MLDKDSSGLGIICLIVWLKASKIQPNSLFAISTIFLKIEEEVLILCQSKKFLINLEGIICKYEI